MSQTQRQVPLQHRSCVPIGHMEQLLEWSKRLNLSSAVFCASPVEGEPYNMKLLYYGQHEPSTLVDTANRPMEVSTHEGEPG